MPNPPLPFFACLYKRSGRAGSDALSSTQPERQQWSSGQVKQNKTAIAALSLQANALSLPEGDIEITTGVNGTFSFWHVVAESSISTEEGASTPISKTYTIVFAGRKYSTDQLLTTINDVVVAQGSVANGITTIIAYIDDRFVIRCTASVVIGIQVLTGTRSAGQALGFSGSQRAGAFNDIEADNANWTDLDLVASATVSTAPIATASDNKATIGALLLRVDELESAGRGGTSLVTTQVTGDYPVPTVGTLVISDAELTTVTFADAFSNDISHALDASIFNVTTVADCTITVQLQVTAGTITHRGLYWASCRRYKNRTTTEAIGTAYGTITLVRVTTRVVVQIIRSCWAGMCASTSNQQWCSFKSSSKWRIYHCGSSMGSFQSTKA